MIETTDRTAPPHEIPPGSIPSDILLSLIAAFLAPMFLTASGGDMALARMAAIGAINAHRARDDADLFAIAQIVACGLAALGSLSLSLLDDISLSMTLRLRGNAVALNRAAEQNRRVLRQIRPDEPPAGRAFSVEPNLTATQDDEKFESEVMANLAAAQQATAEARARLLTIEPPASPPSPAPIPETAQTVQTQAAQTQTAATPEPPKLVARPVTDQQWQAVWASAMTDVAGEFTANLQNLPPAERKQASHRAAALSSCAHQLLSGNVPPAPKPGDLAWIRRPNPT